MLTNEERREVAARLREYESLREAFMESPLCAFLDALGVEGYIDWKGVVNLLADLIEPEPERTCKMIPFVEEDDSVFIVNCSECGDAIFARGGEHYCNFCPSCGAKVVE